MTPSIRTFPRGDVLTVDPGTPVAELAARMDREDVGFVVVTEGDRPVGTVSDRDVATRVAGEGHDPSELAAREVMDEEVHTADADAGVFEVLEQLSEAGVRRLVAVDDDGTVAGIVTLDDFLVLLTREFDRLSAVVESQVPDYRKESPTIPVLDRGPGSGAGTEPEPADAVTLGAAASVLLSLYEFYRGNRDRGIFVGHWPPTILAFATYLRKRRKNE